MRYYRSNPPSDADIHYLTGIASRRSYSTFVITADVVYLLLPSLETKHVSDPNIEIIDQQFLKRVDDSLLHLMENVMEDTESEEINRMVDTLIVRNVREVALKLGVVVYAGGRNRTGDYDLRLHKIA